MTNDQLPKGAGRAVFVSALAALIGVFNVVQGLVLVIEDERYVATTEPDLVLVGDFTTWGWVLLLLGVFQLFVSAAIFKGQLWGRVFGILGASLVAIGQLPVLAGDRPFWSLVTIALCVWLIAGLAEFDMDDR